MKLSKIMLVLVVMIVGSSLLLSAAPKRGKKYAELTFNKGDMFLTPQIGFNSWAIPFGVNFEYAMTENIGVGGTVMLWFWSDAGFSATGIIPSAEAAYHFTQLEVDKLDLSAGGGLGFFIYSSTGGGGTGGIYPYIFFNGRYFFKPNMAVNLRVPIAFGTWGQAGACIGVTFRI
ncbi:MAG: hypothetical protein L6428_14435 [Candidatus Aminicenantes bacterium]|nr:hypothetical protein [Candidatus Aminicenantes bacterium]